MRYLVDTNVISDARRSRSLHVRRWLATQERDSLVISAITILELERDVRAKERVDPLGAASLRTWLDANVRVAFDGRILPVDERVASTAAMLHVPDPLPDMDALIAATALVHDLTVVTRSVRDFRRTGVRLLDPNA